VGKDQVLEGTIPLKNGVWYKIINFKLGKITYIQCKGIFGKSLILARGGDAARASFVGQ